MSHGPTSMNRNELREYVDELLAFHDRQIQVIDDLTEQVANCSSWKETVRDLFDLCHIKNEFTPMQMVDYIEQCHHSYFCGENPEHQRSPAHLKDLVKELTRRWNDVQEIHGATWVSRMEEIIKELENKVA